MFSHLIQVKAPEIETELNNRYLAFLIGFIIRM